MAEKISEFFILGLQVDCLQSAFSLKICAVLIPASDCKQRCYNNGYALVYRGS